MATVAPHVSGLQDMFECPVCLDYFKDPRILACGHHFCRHCLEGIAGVYTLLKCPTCRHDTRLGAGKRVVDLPRPVLVNELQKKISSLLLGSHSESTKYCDPCGKNKVTAVSHCYQCKQNICNRCEDKHKQVSMFAEHRTEPITSCVFCDSHQGDVIAAYCKDCNTALCLKCIMGAHSNHNMEDMHKLATVSRQRLEKFVKQGGLALDQARVKEVKKQISEAEKLGHKFRGSVSSLRGLLKEFEQKIDRLEKNTENKLSAEIKNMKLHASGLNDLVSSRTRLLDYAKHLMKNSPEAELVLQEQRFPTIRDGASLVPSFIASLPEFEATFNILFEGLRGLIDTCEIKFRSHDLNKSSVITTRDASPLAKLKEIHSIPLGCWIHGLALDIKGQLLAVRTNDKASPIQVYDYNGKLLKRSGSGIDGMVDELIRGVSVDTKRSLLLCPVEGALDLIDRVGKVTSTVNVGSELWGISYSAEEDVYVVSDTDTDKVYVIDATSHKIVTEFGGVGSEDGQFVSPHNVHVAYVKNHGKSIIAVSDFGNHRVKLHDMRGRLIKTYGSEGKEDGQLQYPWGVTIDPEGRIIVCDRDNKRVVLFWSENNQDKWQCLLDSSKLEEELPWHVAYDPLVKILAVGTLGGVQLFQ